MKNVKLPDKPSELIRVALADLAKCEQSKRYTVRMSHWHTPDGSRCNVCLAGAVMAKTLNVNRESFASPYSFNDAHLNGMLSSLDYFRVGNIVGAFVCMGLRPPDGLGRKRRIAGYTSRPKQFKADMRQLAKDLEAAGL